MRGRGIQLSAAIGALAALAVVLMLQLPATASTRICLLRVAGGGAERCGPRPEITFDARTFPSPGKVPVPVSLRVKASFTTLEGALPPPMEALTFDFDRGG